MKHRVGKKHSQKSDDEGRCRAGFPLVLRLSCTLRSGSRGSWSTHAQKRQCAKDSGKVCDQTEQQAKLKVTWKENP